MSGLKNLQTVCGNLLFNGNLPFHSVSWHMKQGSLQQKENIRMRFVQSLFLKSQHIWLSLMDKITRDKTLVPPGARTY